MPLWDILRPASRTFPALTDPTEEIADQSTLMTLATTAAAASCLATSAIAPAGDTWSTNDHRRIVAIPTMPHAVMAKDRSVPALVATAVAPVAGITRRTVGQRKQRY
jgi:hypothetical protein